MTLRCATCGKHDCPNYRHAGVARVECEHPNEERTWSDSTSHYGKCPDCGAETREDR